MGWPAAADADASGAAAEKEAGVLLAAMACCTTLTDCAISMGWKRSSVITGPEWVCVATKTICLGSKPSTLASWAWISAMMPVL